MIQLSERLELRLDEETIRGIDSWRAQQAGVPSRSEAVRRLIDMGLGAGGRNLSFSKPELLMAHMLCDLLRPAKDRELDPEFIAEALSGGHFWGLEWKHTGIFHDSKDEVGDVKEVVDILDMWSFVEEGIEDFGAPEKKRFSDETKYTLSNARFHGFDGNNETEHMGIARFLVEKLDRFSRFEGRDLNSHSPSMDAHRRMLKEFLPMRETLVGKRLSIDQLIEIFKARVHPSMRK